MSNRLVRLSISGVLLLATTFAWGQKPPQWFSEPPRDTADVMYGIGEGASPEAARQAALVAVAAGLRVSVASELRNTIKDKNGQVDIEAYQKIESQVAKTEFTRAEIVSSAKSQNGVLVLVKVDRQNFLRDTRGKLDVIAKPIGDAEGSLAGASGLEQFLALRRVNEQIEQAITLSLLLTSAGAESEGRPGFIRFSNLQQRSKDAAAGLVFELKFKPEDADIAKSVAGLLADQNIRSATTRTPGAAALLVDAQTRQDEIYGDKLVKLKVRFSVTDDKGRAVASREHEVSGRSRYDFKGARESAVGKLTAAMNEAGPLAAFGFKQ